MEGPDSVGERSPAARFRAHVVNPVLRVLLRSPAHRLLSGSVLLLQYTGRRTGRRYGLPVMYASSGGEVIEGEFRVEEATRHIGR